MVSNRSVLKTYAPQARKDFIQAMSNRAALFGITKAGALPGEAKGNLFLVGGRAFPRGVAEQRARLIGRIKATSFDQTMEAVAYTWFNRFVAIRYMELHGYLDHSYRVFSHPKGEAEPEILQQARHLTLPGLDPEMVVTLRLDGAKDEVLYRRILIAQCNDLHRAMPFLFERIDDETELLLPENLLQSDSIVRKLVGEIAETEWEEIEIIGWLYQFYISEKKDQVIGNVVKSEDIPAATQLFTPNWIVKYMVQNSLGAQWLATYPGSPLRAMMMYYIEPAEQAPEVSARLATITPNHLEPEAITLIDPAVGSGHILVEAYDVFRAIYLERGYTPQEAARAILTKNLFGLDIDDRAGQIAGFALLMKARADDRTLLHDTPLLNVMSLVDSGGWDADAMADALAVAGPRLEAPTDSVPEAPPQLRGDQSGDVRAAISAIVSLFDGAKTFGSLITVPDKVVASLTVLEALLSGSNETDMLRRMEQFKARRRLAVLVAQARVLARQFDCVVANPPYMGGKGMNPKLKRFVQSLYPDSKADLFATFVERNLLFATAHGSVGMIAMQSWMFLSSYEKLRAKILENNTIMNMAHLGARAFDSISGEVVSTSAFVILKCRLSDYRGKFLRLISGVSESSKKTDFRRAVSNPRENDIFEAAAKDFRKIPGRPIAYWVSERLRDLFTDFPPLSDIAKPRQGLATSDNNRFLRQWFEPSFAKIGIGMGSRQIALESKKKWFPCQKGGSFRKWYGNINYVINWENDGTEIINYATELYGSPTKRVANASFYFKEGATWSTISSGSLSMRYSPVGFISETKGAICFSDSHELNLWVLGFTNSCLVTPLLKAVSPTLDFHEGPVGRLPLLSDIDSSTTNAVELLVDYAKADWDRYETSWDFKRSPLFGKLVHKETLQDTYISLREFWNSQVREMKTLEEGNNRRFMDAYRLADELTPEVPLSEISLTCNPRHRYGGNLTDEEFEARLRADTMRELISYGVGLMMGRYSLHEPGLVYAEAGGRGFDPARYGAFPADDDGIVPVTEDPWFPDDAAARLEQFLQLAWPCVPMGESLATLIDGLNQGKGDEHRPALRAYLSRNFYIHHLQTYRNRPIYWLFSSGKQKAFECLVYLHRYNESTLARMRTAYVTPLMGKMQQRIADLDADIAQSTSSAEKTRKGREKDKAIKQLMELRSFDEELRHLADQRIALDLDDGVKVNYGRFGNLLAAMDKICGKDNDKDD